MNLNTGEVSSETLTETDYFLGLLKSLQSPEQPNYEEKALKIWHEKKEKLKQVLLEAYTATDQKFTLIAIAKYELILNEFEEHKYNEEYGYSEEELGAILFQLSLLYLEVRDYSCVVKAIKMLEVCEPLLPDHTPMLKYGLAKSYIMLNRFKMAMTIINAALGFLDKTASNGNEMPQLLRPATNTTINESCKNKLRRLLEEILDQCRYVPPVGICRYENCIRISSHILPSTSIYQNDLYYKGFVRIICESGCKIVYHLPCWKKLRSSFHLKSHNDLLNSICQTSDCIYVVNGKSERSKVVETKIYDCDGSLKSAQNAKNENEKKVKDKSNSGRSPRVLLTIKRNINNNFTSEDSSTNKEVNESNAIKENVDPSVENTDRTVKEDKSEFSKMYSSDAKVFNYTKQENLEQSPKNSEYKNWDNVVTPRQFMSNISNNQLQSNDQSIIKRKELITPAEFVKRITLEELENLHEKEKNYSSREMNSEELLSKEITNSVNIKKMEDKYCQTISSELVDADKEKYIQHLEAVIAESNSEKNKLQSILDIYTKENEKLRSDISKLEEKSVNDSAMISKLESKSSYDQFYQQHSVLLYTNLTQYCLLLIDSHLDECNRVIQTNKHILQGKSFVIPNLLLQEIQSQTFQWNERLYKIQMVRNNLLTNFYRAPQTSNCITNSGMYVPDITKLHSILANKPNNTSDMVLLYILNQQKINQGSRNHYLNANMRALPTPENSHVESYDASILECSTVNKESIEMTNNDNINFLSTKINANIRYNYNGEEEKISHFPKKLQHTGTIPKVKQQTVNTTVNKPKSPDSRVQNFFMEFRKKADSIEKFTNLSKRSEGMVEVSYENPSINLSQDSKTPNQKSPVFDLKKFDESMSSKTKSDVENWDNCTTFDTPSNDMDPKKYFDIKKLNDSKSEHDTRAEIVKILANSKDNLENSTNTNAKIESTFSESKNISFNKICDSNSKKSVIMRQTQNEKTENSDISFEHFKSHTETIKKSETNPISQTAVKESQNLNDRSSKKSITFAEFMDMYLPRMFPNKSVKEIRFAYYAITNKCGIGTKPKEVVAFMNEYFKASASNKK